MAEYERRVREEVAATIERAGFGTLSPGAIRVEITDSFQRRLGECRREPRSDGEAERYVIRIARRLFEADDEERWRDTVRHEVAHAHVRERHGEAALPHGEEWKEAARRAGADPSARYEGEDLVDANYVLACPDGCFERGYLKRSKRIRKPWMYGCPDCATHLVSYDAGDPPADPEPGTCHVASLPQSRPEDDVPGSGANYVLACPNGCAAWPYQRRSKRVKNPWLYRCPECEADLVSYDADDRPADPEPGTCYVASVPWSGPRYVHACPNGCFATGYGDQRDEIRNPSDYRCESCDERTVSYPVGERPGDPVPGDRYGGQ